MRRDGIGKQDRVHHALGHSAPEADDYHEYADVRRFASWALIALCVWWNLGLMAQFGTGTMNRQRLELGRNAWNTFVVLPQQAPELARRYLFDRASFYKPRPRS